MTATTARKFDRHDAAAVRRAARTWLGKRTAVIEAGLRRDESGALTVNSARWHEDADLIDLQPELRDISEDIAPGFTLDLYCYDQDAGLIQNLDARWTGDGWEVFDPFAPDYVERISDKPRTRNNRAAYWVIVRSTYGEDRVVYRTNSHDDALCFLQEYCMGAGDYNVRIQDNVI